VSQAAKISAKRRARKKRYRECLGKGEILNPCWALIYVVFWNGRINEGQNPRGDPKSINKNDATQGGWESIFEGAVN